MIVTSVHNQNNILMDFEIHEGRNATSVFHSFAISAKPDYNKYMLNNS